MRNSPDGRRRLVRLLDRPGLRWVLFAIRSAQQSRRHRWPILVVRRDDLWEFRAWRAPIVVSPRSWWNGPWFDRDQTIELLFHRYAPQSGDVVVDVGAGVGDAVPYLASAVGPMGRVLAIEAHPTEHRALAGSIVRNRLSNCTAAQVAASDANGVVTIADGDRPESNSIVTGEAGIAVPSVRLDDLLDAMGVRTIDLLKMNIEGSEVAALRGMPRALVRTRNVVISCHDFIWRRTGDPSFRTKGDVVELLIDAGFDVTFRDDDREFVADYVYGTRPPD